jgi:hypothetical protein
MIGSSLRLSYIGLLEQDMLDILLHYQDNQGVYFSFALPPDTLSGLTAADYTLSGFSWRYATSPTILDLPCDRYTVEVELESVESKAALISVGLRGRIGLNLLGGSAFAANGIDAEIGLSLDGGTFGTSGFDYTIALAFADNGATGEALVSGASESITISLLSAETTGAVDVNGLSSQIDLLLEPGVGGVEAFADGFNESIALSIQDTGATAASAVDGATQEVSVSLSPGSASADASGEDYWSSWVEQNYGFESLYFIDWWVT